MITTITTKLIPLLEGTWPVKMLTQQSFLDLPGCRLTGKI